MLLNVGERAALLKVLPGKGEYVIMKQVLELQTRLMITTAEEEEFEFKLNTQLDLYTWNDKGRENPVEIAITVQQMKIISDTLHDFRKDITLTMIPLWERFML